jgi:hypothetical protein
MSYTAKTTAQTYDGITVDLNRITRAEYRRLMDDIFKAEGDEDAESALTGELAEKIITHWPFQPEINRAGYLALGIMDAKRVDAAMLQAIAEMQNGKGKKVLAADPPGAANDRPSDS